MSEQRRDGDKELFETIGQVKEFMKNYQIEKAAEALRCAKKDAEEERQRGEDRREARSWREEFAEKQEELTGSVQTLKDRLDNLTAPARWAVGLAAIITAFGVLAAYGKRIVLSVRALMGG